MSTVYNWELKLFGLSLSYLNKITRKGVYGIISRVSKPKKFGNNLFL